MNADEIDRLLDMVKTAARKSASTDDPVYLLACAFREFLVNLKNEEDLKEISRMENYDL